MANYAWDPEITTFFTSDSWYCGSDPVMAGNRVPVRIS